MLDKTLTCILVITQPNLTNISSSEAPAKTEKIESVYTENINLKKSYQLICTDGKKKRNDNHKNIPASTRIASKR